MSAMTTVPVTIGPEAAARLAELGLQAELEQMLEQIRQVVPQLRSIEVRADSPSDTFAEPGLSVLAWTGLPWQQADEVWRPLARWRRAAFPPQVCERLSVDVMCGGHDAGQRVSGPGPGAGHGER